MVSVRTKLLLCNYDELAHEFDFEDIEKLWSGNYAFLIKQNSFLKDLLPTEINSHSIRNIIKNENKERIEELLVLGVSSLLYFCKANWSAKVSVEPLSDIFGTSWPQHVEASCRLQRDSEEIDNNTQYCELLLLAEEILDALCSLDESLLHLWWYHRCLVTHQRVLDNACPSLYSQLELISAKLLNLSQSLQEEPRLSIVLLAEIAQGFLVYGRVQRVDECLERAKNVAGLRLELQGVLGKRTKFQQRNLPQLALFSELDSTVTRASATDTHGNTNLPKQLELQDDVRLNNIAYAEDSLKNVELPSLEQMLCLLSAQYLQKSQPKDNLADEELQPYIDTVLRQASGAWCVRVATLLFKCRLESNNKRTVERAMMQCEAIVNEAHDNDSVDRLSYLWASGLAPSSSWQQQLADLYLSLGLVKAALELYLSLQLWEDVIVCYSLLQLRHKAAEIIQQKIDLNPTPKLYCLLGDATDDVSCYERAWEFSGHKSGRAQRHWGNFLFDRKRYNECIPHYEKSLEINSIQEGVWLRLAYAALSTEQWEKAAAGYRRYTYLQPNTFEAWNNLAKVYVKQGDKQRAYRALMEALKFNYDNWKLWENVITVSIDTGHFEDVLHGVHRLLDINGKFGDVEVLALLTRAVLEDHKDAEGNSAARLHRRLLELMGRVTSAHATEPQLWKLYADMSPTELLRAQRLLRAYRGYTQESEWPNNPESCKKVIELTYALLDSSLKAKKSVEDSESMQAAQQLSSARLTGQAVIKALERHNWTQLEDSLQSLKVKFDELMECVKST